MNNHKNARLTPYSRALLVQRVERDGLRVTEAAKACGVSPRTAYKWLARYREEGAAGLENRRSRPHSHPKTTSESLRKRIVDLRQQRRTYRWISLELGVSVSTVGRVAKQAGINRLSALEPAPEITRYNRERAGEMIHLDIKKLARFNKPGHRVTNERRKDSIGVGWEYVHVAIDDASRISYSTIWPDETSCSACKALIEALRYYRSLGITVERVLTDNGPCYRSKRFAALCRRLGIKHKHTKPYRPQTNGKAERFIQTALREWAYARSYENSQSRAEHLPLWQHQYNWHRPHASLDYKTPISFLGLDANNLMELHT